MKTLIKLLMFLWFLIQYSYAYVPYNPTECSLSRYQGQSKCIKLVYDEVNERLERAYKNIIDNIPRVDTIEIVQEYTSLLKSKNEICAKNPKNKIKATCEIEGDLVYDPHDETELDCEIAKDKFCELYKYYGNIFKNIPEYNTTTIAKEYNSWLKSKNDYCKRYSNNEIKLKSCHIDYSIPKLNELWEIESILLEYPFEGKWVSCGYDEGNFTCRTYFIIEQGDNACSSNWQGTGSNDSYISISLEEKYANRLYSIKLCDEDIDDWYHYVGCRIFKDGYDEKGRMTYKTSVPFSQWEKDDDEGGRWVQYYYKNRYPSSGIKTPFLPGEKEELIQTNKWLQDCLNYKGE